MELLSLHKRARKQDLGDAEIITAMQSEGLFGVISSHEYPCREILPTYYQRQSIEQIFDFVKNYTKLLPLHTQNENVLRGAPASFVHCLLQY